MQQLTGPRRGVSQLAFSPDGDMLAAAGDKTVWCWTRSRAWEPSGLRGRWQMSNVAFHPTGRTLAYVVAGGYLESGRTGGPQELPAVCLHALNPEGEFEPNRLEFEPGAVLPHQRVSLPVGMAFTPGGRTLLTGGNVRTGVFRESQHFLRWNFREADGQWQVENALPLRTEADRGVMLVEPSCLALMWRWGVALCPLGPDSAARLRVPDVSRCDCLAVAPVEELIATADYSAERVQVWSLRDARPVTAWRGQPRVMAFSADGQHLATESQSRVVTLRNPQTGDRVQDFDFGVGAIQSLAFAPDGLTLAVAGSQGLVVVDVD